MTSICAELYVCGTLCLYMCGTLYCSVVSNEILAVSSGAKLEPQFMEPIENVTVVVGREAVLSCVVDNLDDYRVGWLKSDTQTILSLQKRVVTHNTRVSITHDEHRTWSLHIKQVKETDRGCYMCQINTPIMKNQVGCLEVLVPPDIMDSETSADTTVNEGENVNLRCRAVGYPQPEITWRREDGRTIRLQPASGTTIINLKTGEEVRGENLTLESVSRQQMGAYLCIASNQVPPTVSKRIILSVNFSPVVSVNEQLIGSPLGKDVTVECRVEAFPHSVNYWQKEEFKEEMLLKGDKYNIREDTDSYRVTMVLTIKHFTNEDPGHYKCISSNSLGQAETVVNVYAIETPS
ncbi:unnamed protein product, partial [Meganyctiphanes norvegica]